MGNDVRGKLLAGFLRIDFLKRRKRQALERFIRDFNRREGYGVFVQPKALLGCRLRGLPLVPRTTNQPNQESNSQHVSHTTGIHLLIGFSLITGLVATPNRRIIAERKAPAGVYPGFDNPPARRNIALNGCGALYAKRNSKP
jgi:hypothetical protein